MHSLKLFAGREEFSGSVGWLSAIGLMAISFVASPRRVPLCRKSVSIRVHPWLSPFAMLVRLSGKKFP
jgi:hypothetical protein